jgi:hypothetical protein
MEIFTDEFIQKMVMDGREDDVKLLESYLRVLNKVHVKGKRDNISSTLKNIADTSSLTLTERKTIAKAAYIIGKKA